jgi:hypothetical protein
MVPQVEATTTNRHTVDEHHPFTYDHGGILEAWPFDLVPVAG